MIQSVTSHLTLFHKRHTYKRHFHKRGHSLIYHTGQLFLYVIIKYPLFCCKPYNTNVNNMIWTKLVCKRPNVGQKSLHHIQERLELNSPRFCTISNDPYHADVTFSAMKIGSDGFTNYLSIDEETHWGFTPRSDECGWTKKKICKNKYKYEYSLNSYILHNYTLITQSFQIFGPNLFVRTNEPKYCRDPIL